MKTFDFNNYILYSLDSITIITMILLLCFTHYYIISFIFVFIIFIFMLYYYRGKSYSLKFYPFYDDFISCPAQGKILQIKIFQQEYICISIFINWHNIHIQYAPCNGIIDYFTGAFILKNNIPNEKKIYCIKTLKWDTIYLCQIAGRLTRQIISLVKAEETIKQGQPLGLIKFGSMVDIIIPCKYVKKILVLKDQNVEIDQPIVEMVN